MAHPGHQFLGGRSSGCGQCVPGMPQVVQPKLWEADFLPGPAPCSFHRVEAQRSAPALGENEVVSTRPDVVSKMSLYVLGYVRRDRDCPPPRVGFRRPDHDRVVPQGCA
jgi:hypothetical protein